ncbi:MAG: ABC transporter permease subunit [Pirellulaceae bacterium]|nr:ABC transporter permease subunit [Pirellulaceae bacterium]
MNWLIWKEYRLNRLILGAGLFLLLLPHAIALVNGLRHLGNWSHYFEQSMMFSFYVTHVILALLGGNSIAGERGDRSAEFLATLPLSRRRNLASKLVLGPLAVAVIWGVNLLIFLFVSGASPGLTEILREFAARPDLLFRRELLLFFGCVGGTGLAFFCVGWSASSFLNSSVYASAIALMTPLTVIMGIQGVIWWTETRFYGRWEEPATVACWYASICITLSVAAFIAGTWYYLRRVEP